MTFDEYNNLKVGDFIEFIPMECHRIFNKAAGQPLVVNSVASLTSNAMQCSTLDDRIRNSVICREGVKRKLDPSNSKFVSLIALYKLKR